MDPDELAAAEDVAAAEEPMAHEGTPMTELERIRHSCAHVLATAILRLWPEAQFAAGPPVENGFYYDVELPYRISPEDFEKIEAGMKKEIKANHRFERSVVTREQALALARRGELASLGARPEPSKFKLDIVENIPPNEEISLYRNGDFLDLCAGPHVMRTGNIGAFRLTNVASAYYKGDERNPQLQRIYGTAFKNETQLDEYFAMLEEAKKRDHRKLGKELELFAFDDDVGPGLPLWLPRGAAIIEELEKLAKETEFAGGYQRVRTTNLARESLYIKSGHLPYYKDSMFPPMELEEGRESSDRESLHREKDNDDPRFTNVGSRVTRYYLKAMNCPHHHKVYAAVPRSYRDLPLRLAEYGFCHRYEQSGELFGLMRVRSLQMNDAHIYCTTEQFESEFNAVNQMYLRYFKLFGIERYVMRYSTHDPTKLGQKFVNEPELWIQTEKMVRDVLQRSGINYVEVPNEAAFYGPKIDVQVWSAIGREFTIATNQVDFAVPKRFDLVYKDRDNTEKTPLCIHRAPLGTHERFIGFLIEHYAGNFPLWLNPEQVRILPIGDEAPLLDYARGILEHLRAKQVRGELDASNDKINGKIQRAEQMKVHTMLVIGKRDLEANAVSVRVHGQGNLGTQPRDQFIAELLEKIATRAA
jgi:threonyl-tRNA synthetase